MEMRIEDLNPKAIVRRVRDIVANEELLHQTAKASYAHANGFFKIVLDDGDTKRRLHYWRPLRDFPENIHNHRWHLVSRILYGCMKENRYSIGDGDSHELFASFPRIGQEINVNKIPDSLCRVNLDEQRTYYPGDVYECPAGEFHQTFISNHPSPVLTACLTYKPVAEHAVVANPVDSKANAFTVSSAGFTAAELKSILNEILELLPPILI